jgi:uncharacterized protein YceK
MARAAATAIWAGVVASALSGCGTVHNFCGDKADAPQYEVFGGVRSDVSVGVEHLHFDPTVDHGDYPARTCADPTVQFCAKAIGWYLLAVDLPLSAVGDTLTLPVTLPVTLVSQLVGKPAPPASHASQPRRTPAPTSEASTASPSAPKDGESP